MWRRLDSSIHVLHVQAWSVERVCGILHRCVLSLVPRRERSACWQHTPWAWIYLLCESCTSRGAAISHHGERCSGVRGRIERLTGRWSSLGVTSAKPHPLRGRGTICRTSSHPRLELWWDSQGTGLPQKGKRQRARPRCRIVTTNRGRKVPEGGASRKTGAKR